MSLVGVNEQSIQRVSVTRAAKQLVAVVADLQLDEAVRVMREVLDTPTIITANQMPQIDHVTTFSRRLDCLLGGGFAVGGVTELIATPGGGKTQLCLQACVSVCLPVSLGSLDGSAVYVDTEAGFNMSRLTQVAEAAVSHCQHSSDAPTLSAADILRRIRVIQCVDLEELLLVPLALTQLLRDQGDDPPVRLIVLDSIAAPFRGYCADYAQRAMQLQWLAGELWRLARHRAAAVVITNHMTTSIGSGGESRLVPALGDRWQHSSSVRVRLDWHAGDVTTHVACTERRAVLTKHWCKPSGLTTRFQILASGIRDVLDSDPSLVESTVNFSCGEVNN